MPDFSSQSMVFDKILADRLEGISEESAKKANAMLINPHLLSNPTRSNIILLWANFFEYQKKQQAVSLEYPADKPKSVCSMYTCHSRSNYFCLKETMIGDKYTVPNSVLAMGLSQKKTLEAYFRYIIRQTWKRDEYCGRTINGKHDKEPVDREKLNAFINYAISSWNDHHATSIPTKGMVIPQNQITYRKNKLRNSFSQLCSDATRKFAVPKVPSSASSVSSDTI